MEQAGNTIRCQNCGHENQAGDTYCANCGARLRTDVSIPPQYPSPQGAPPPQAAPPPPPPTAPQTLQPVPGQDQLESEWRMSNLGPPPKPKRRVWLWVIIGLIIACVLICVAFGIFVNTGTGSRWFSDLATEAAKKATQQAR